MRTRAIGSLVAAFVPTIDFLRGDLTRRRRGYLRPPQSFNGDAFAVAPDGKVAVARLFRP